LGTLQHKHFAKQPGHSSTALGLEENEAGVWHGKPRDHCEVHNKQKWHLIANDIYTHSY